MTEPSNQTASRRAVLRGGVTGALAASGLLAAGTASAQQGGVAYLRASHLRGKNNPNEPRFVIVERCGTETLDIPCDGPRERTYAAYKIRCPNFGGGGCGDDHGDGCGGDVHTADHEDDCGGGHGNCGRRILVNPNRSLRAGGTYVFNSDHACGETYVKASFRPV